MPNRRPIHEFTGTPLECSAALTPEAREEVFRLRYTCYRRRESIGYRTDQRFRDEFDELPNSFSFLTRLPDHEPLATVRITVVRPELGWIESPVGRVYGDHRAFQEIAGESFVEASRLCFGRQARRDTFLRLLGNMAALAELYQVSWLIACPRVEHVPVYRRMFGFRPLAAPRQYFGVKFQTQLLGIRRREIHLFTHEDARMTSAWSEALAQIAEVLPVSETRACA